MGSIFKHKSSTSKETTDTKNENLLAKDKNFMSMFTQANAEAAKINVPEYQIAGFGQEYLNAESNLLKGVDLSSLKNAQNYMLGNGQNQLNSGLALQSQSQGLLSQLANLSQEDLQKGYQSEFNSQLVKEQIAAASEDINKQRDEAIYQLNENATSSGNMGSSRSGISQALIVGQAARAVGQASVQYRTAEEQNAFNRYTTFLNTRQQSASSLANLAQNQIATGTSLYSQGMNYNQMYNADWLQNQQNALNIGANQQARAQQMLDIQRQNQLMSQSPALARLAYAGPILQPFAANGQYGQSVKTTVTPGQGSIFGGLAGMAGSALAAYATAGTSLAAQAGGISQGVGGFASQLGNSI